MKKYLYVMGKSFKNCFAYRAEALVGIVNMITMLVVNVSLWKAIYSGSGEIHGQNLSSVITYLFLSMVIFQTIAMDEYYIEGRVNSGSILFDFIRPVRFRMYVLANSLGGILFRLFFLLLPTTVFAVLVYHVQAPASWQAFLLFVVSLILGVLVMYQLNYIIWLSAFWIYKTFSLVTIKETVVMILAGSVVPLWFFPDKIMNVLSFTPFRSILYIPISIYLGEVKASQSVAGFANQIVWLVLLFLIGEVLWWRAKKRLVIQGG